MQTITPFLWFNDQAEEAVNFYVSIFRNSKVVTITRYGDAGPGPKGSVMTAAFDLNGQRFIALNGGPTSPSRPRCRSSSTATRRKSSTCIGTSCPRGATRRHSSAVG